MNRELPRLLRKDSDFDEYRQSLDETGRTLREWLWNPEKRQAFLSALTEELLELTHESGGLAGNTNLLNIKRLLQLRLPPKFRRFKDRDALLVRNQKSLVFFLKHYFDVYVQVDVLDKLIERRLSEKFLILPLEEVVPLPKQLPDTLEEMEALFDDRPSPSRLWAYHRFFENYRSEFIEVLAECLSFLGRVDGEDDENSQLTEEARTNSDRAESSTEGIALKLPPLLPITRAAELACKDRKTIARWLKSSEHPLQGTPDLKFVYSDSLLQYLGRSKALKAFP